MAYFLQTTNRLSLSDLGIAPEESQDGSVPVEQDGNLGKNGSLSLSLSLSLSDLGIASEESQDGSVPVEQDGNLRDDVLWETGLSPRPRSLDNRKYICTALNKPLLTRRIFHKSCSIFKKQIK